MTFAGEVNALELYAEATLTVTNGKITSITCTTTSNTNLDGLILKQNLVCKLVLFLF